MSENNSENLPNYVFENYLISRELLYIDIYHGLIQKNNIIYPEKSICNHRKVMRDSFIIACQHSKEFLTLPLYTDDGFSQYKIIIFIEEACYNKALIDASIDINAINVINEPSIDNTLVISPVDKMFFTNKQLLDIYSSICYKFLANIDINSSIKSDEFITNICNGNVDINNIINLKSEELCPKVSERLRNLVILRQNIKIDEKVTTNYTCPKCKNKESTYGEMQIKSSDEPADIRHQCVKCKHIWF